MNKIVIDKVLEAIHYVLEHNEFKFTEKQIKRADQEIIPFINELDIDESDFKVITYGAPKLSYDRRIVPILVRYFAFIEDNISLYNELLEEDFLFYENYSIKFYALDRVITGNFKRNEYKKLLLKYEDVVSSFYFSIRGLDKSEKEKYSKDFSDIIHRDATTLKVGFDKYGEINNYNFLIKSNFELFGKDFLLELNNNQREVINKIHFKLDEEDVLKIKKLITKYPNYNGVISLSKNLLNNFSVDEISSMSIKDCILYEASLKVGLIDRMKNILKLDSSFDCEVSFIKEEIFRVLSDFEIIELSDEGKKEISKIKIPEINNVIVMPVKKIRRELFLDKMRKFGSDKIDSIKGSIKK